MPNRYVRDTAIESERVNKLSWQGEVFYRRLINRVDDFGRYTAHPDLLRASIFPLQLNKVSAADVSKLLLECEQAGLLGTWKGQLDGKPYLVMNIWEKGRAKLSKYPEPPSDVCKCLRVFTYVSDSDTDSDTDNTHITRPARNKRIPTLGDAMDYGYKKHPPYTETTIKEWFAHRDSQHWEKTSGIPISNWRSDLDSWSMKNIRDHNNGNKDNRTEADKRREAKRSREFGSENPIEARDL